MRKRGEKYEVSETFSWPSRVGYYVFHDTIWLFMIIKRKWWNPWFDIYQFCSCVDTVIPAYLLKVTLFIFTQNNFSYNRKINYT